MTRHAAQATSFACLMLPRSLVCLMSQRTRPKHAQTEKPNKRSHSESETTVATESERKKTRAEKTSCRAKVADAGIESKQSYDDSRLHIHLKRLNLSSAHSLTRGTLEQAYTRQGMKDYGSHKYGENYVQKKLVRSFRYISNKVIKGVEDYVESPSSEASF